MSNLQFLGGILLAFVAGTGFGAWLALYLLRRSRRLWSKDREAREFLNESGNFKPVDTGREFDPLKQPDYPMETAGERPSLTIRFEGPPQ
jgi:hypothetical protein